MDIDSEGFVVSVGGYLYSVSLEESGKAKDQFGILEWNWTFR